MDRLRRSFRRKKHQKDAEEDGEIDRDDLESKSVFVDQVTENDNTDIENDSLSGSLSAPSTRFQRLRKSLRLTKKKKKNVAEVVTSGDEEPAKLVKEAFDSKGDTRMSKIRASLRINKTSKKEKKEPKKKSSKWETDDTKVRNNHCEFKVKYLGSIEVQESRGMEVCESAIKVLKNQSTKQNKKLRATLHVSGDGLRVVDKETQGMLVDQVIEKVSFCAPDRNFTKGFAYISRDGTSRRWVCHGFLARRDSGERLSHAVGVAFAVCLERKQTRECEGVSGSWDENSGAFTRFGSFRQGTLTERLADPQEFKVTPLKVELGLIKEENPFAISRPRPGGDVGGPRASLRGLPGANVGLGVIKGQSPFKRGTEQYSSLRPQDLPSTIQRKEKSRVSLILEETFENEETKNEINDLIIQMSEKSRLSPTQELTEDQDVNNKDDTPENHIDTSKPTLVTVVANQLNNNDTDFKLANRDETTNPWDLVPDQPRIKSHSRTNSNTNPADKWLASLTSKVSDLGVQNQPVNCNDNLEDEEWEALANRAKAKAINTNPFRACV